MALKEHGYFWNSREKDRVYSADSFSEWAKTFFTTGVFVNTNHVRAASGLTITVDAGYCNVEGKVAIFDAADTLTIATPHASLKRIDTVVIERNDVEREFYRKIVTGNPAANPVAKEPVRANGVYQLVLAQITVGAGVTSITQANIKDTRANANLCGYVAGVAKEISWEQITAQWDAYYEEFKASQFTDFDEWFNHMKGQLTTDAAGNLQTQIDGINGRLGEISGGLDNVEGWVRNLAKKNQIAVVSISVGQIGEEDYSTTHVIPDMYKNERFVLHFYTVLQDMYDKNSADPNHYYLRGSDAVGPYNNAGNNCSFLRVTKSTSGGKLWIRHTISWRIEGNEISIISRGELLSGSGTPAVDKVRLHIGILGVMAVLPE